MARLLVAAGLSAYILYKSDPAAVLAAAAGADWYQIGVAVVLVLLDRTLMAYRWVVLLGTIERRHRPALVEVMRIFFVSTFLGTFLPASIGGDAVRAYSVTKLDVPAGDAVASVFMDRMLGLASALVMALAGLVLARDLAGDWTILFGLSLAGGACAATLLLIFSPHAATAASTVIARLPRLAREPGHRILESIRRYAAYRRQLLGVLACSIAVQILRIVQAYFLGRGLGIAAPIGAYFAFVPLILLIMLLPVTFNGIGTSQVAFVAFFARAGVPRPSAFALSVLFVALGIVGNLPGGILYASGRGSRQDVGAQRPRAYE